MDPTADHGLFQISRPLRAITFSPDDGLNPVRLILVAKETGEAEAVELVVLKVFSGGRTYLAALADRKDRVIEWLEVWVQFTHDLDGSPLARSAIIGNAAHDRQWRETADAMRSVDPGGLIETNWDATPPTPLVVDLRRMAVVRLLNATSQQPLELCRDDAVLSAAGLGAYSSTLERWFFSQSAAGERTWVSSQDLISREPNQSVAMPESGAGTPTMDFNIEAGMMLLRKHPPISVEGLLGWLASITGASPSPALMDNLDPVERHVLDRGRERRESEPSLIHDPVVESAFFRLQLWCSMTREVHALSSRLKMPFFNLATDSFRISVNGAPNFLQTAWTLRTVLTHAGDAIAIKLGQTDFGFAPLQGALASSSAARKFGGCVDGTGTLRIRQIIESGDGGVRLNGVLDGNELKDVSEGNIVWVQALVDGRSVNFFAKIEGDKSGLRAGLPFSATGVALPANAALRLKATARMPCQFVILRPVSPVFDIHALGVIGVRIFLADDPAAVGELVDDLFELAALLPQRESIEDLRDLGATREISDRLRRLLSPPGWARTPGGAALAENVWLATIREIIDFVTAEIPDANEAADENGAAWLQPLAERLSSLEQLAAQVGRLLVAPRLDQDEVARVVHRFL
jgi:hypothetical protein